MKDKPSEPLPVAVGRHSMIHWLKFACSATVNILIAIFGIAIVETPLQHSIPVYTIGQILLRTYICDTMVAAILGYLTYRISESTAAKWIWTAGVGWLLLRVLFSAVSTRHVSLSYFSGTECGMGTQAAGCINWFLVTLPALRLTAFSAGANVCCKLNHKGPHPVLDAAVVKFQPIKFDSEK